MIAAIVITEMIFHRRIGMRNRDIMETVIAGSLACPRQQFEVHHIIDDNRILPFTIIGKVPGTDRLDHRVEPGTERTGACHQHILVSGILCQPVTVAIATIKHEAYIVIIRHMLHFFQAFGKKSGILLQFGSRIVFIQIPEFTGEETAAPPIAVAGFQFAIFDALRQPAILLFQLFGHKQRLFGRGFQTAVNHFRKRFLLRGITTRRQQQCGR